MRWIGCLVHLVSAKRGGRGSVSTGPGVMKKQKVDGKHQGHGLGATPPAGTSMKGK